MLNLLEDFVCKVGIAAGSLRAMVICYAAIKMGPSVHGARSCPLLAQRSTSWLPSPPWRMGHPASYEALREAVAALQQQQQLWFLAAESHCQGYPPEPVPLLLPCVAVPRQIGRAVASTCLPSLMRSCIEEKQQLGRLAEYPARIKRHTLAPHF